MQTVSVEDVWPMKKPEARFQWMQQVTVSWLRGFKRHCGKYHTEAQVNKEGSGTVDTTKKVNYKT